jgi:hypothetical protein
MGDDLRLRSIGLVRGLRRSGQYLLHLQVKHIYTCKTYLQVKYIDSCKPNFTVIKPKLQL